MNKVFEIYQILEDFNYKFPIHELNLRWDIYGSPRDITEMVEKRVGELNKTKEAYREKMKEDQKDFSETYENLRQCIVNFHQYSDIKNHEEVAKIVQEV